MSAICQACGRPARDGDPLVTVHDDLAPPEGWRVHQSHTVDPQSGLHGRAAR